MFDNRYLERKKIALCKLVQVDKDGQEVKDAWKVNGHGIKIDTFGLCHRLGGLVILVKLYTSDDLPLETQKLIQDHWLNQKSIFQLSPGISTSIQGIMNANVIRFLSTEAALSSYQLPLAKIVKKVNE